MTGEPLTLDLPTQERLSKLGSGDAVKMLQRARERSQTADRKRAEGDQIGSVYEQAEADRLKLEAELILDPVMHTTGRVTVGNGGEIAIGTREMSPYIDTVRQHPDMLVADASRQRMELADRANVLQLGLDAAATVQARNSTERMLMHQMAAAHVAAMELQAEARALMRTYKRTGYEHQHLSVEAGRLMNASARMMDSYQRGMLTLERIRSGGRQTVVVQHVNVSDGGQAVVAGQVKTKTKQCRRRGNGGD